MAKRIQAQAFRLFEKQQYDEALPLFEQVASAGNGSEDWFNVATCAVMARQLDKGSEALSKAISLAEQEQNPENLSIGMMQFYFMCALRDSGFVKEGVKVLNDFRQTYTSLVITDDMFLSIRGLPSLSQFLAMGAILLKMQSEIDPKEWLTTFGSTLDADGKATVTTFIDEQWESVEQR